MPRQIKNEPETRARRNEKLAVGARVREINCVLSSSDVSNIGGQPDNGWLSYVRSSYAFKSFSKHV